MLVAGAVLVAGCGGGDEEARSEVRDVVERYVQALRDGDGEAACEVMTRGAVEQLEDEAGAPCPEALADVLGAARSGGEGLADLEVTEVNVSGRVATATIRGAPGGEVTSELMKEQGEWRLASPGS